jgi:hypothetical protein
LSSIAGWFSSMRGGFGKTKLKLRSSAILDSSMCLSDCLGFLILVLQKLVDLKYTCLNCNIHFQRSLKTYKK